MLSEVVLGLVGLAGKILAVEGAVGVRWFFYPDYGRVYAMGEQGFVHFQQCLLIVDKKIKQVAFVLNCEVDLTHSVLCQLGELQ